MCLGVPGKIEKIFQEGNLKMGVVNFDGVTMPVCLETTPEAVVGDYVIVHAGFAISSLNETEALETLQLLKDLDEIQTKLDNK